MALAALSSADECHLTPVIHVLQYPGCTAKPIPSFACAGRCTSYVQVRRPICLFQPIRTQLAPYLQVSGSKFWLQERSCMCCQESGEREAVVQLFCPNAKAGDPKVRRVSKYVTE